MSSMPECYRCGVYVHHGPCLCDDCRRGNTEALNRKREEIERLKAAIKEAPHGMGCKSLQGGPETPEWGSLEKCDCWKRKALEGE